MTPNAADLGLERRLLYRDALVLILDKPPFTPVHAGPKGGRNLEDGFEALRFGLPRLPRLAHRLDRDTSGCLALGRHKRALARLGRLFAAGRAKKTYWAVVEGAPPRDEGVIDLPLAKLSTKRGWWMKPAAPGEGQPAVTRYRLRGRGGGLAWLELEPLTGRTHQLRVHLAHLGAPILGDPIYGSSKGSMTDPPLHLLSRSLTLPLYENRAPAQAIAPAPAHMIEALRRCGMERDDAPGWLEPDPGPRRADRDG